MSTTVKADAVTDATSTQENIGFIIVISGTPTDKETFCQLATGAGFQSVYGTESSSSYGDHIRFSRTIPLSKLREASKPRNRSDITAIQLLSVTEFSGGSGDVDVLISLASLVAALHMRAQPLLGVMFLHSLQVRLGRSASLTLENFGRLFLGSDPSNVRSRFAFVAMNWLRDHPPTTLRGFLQKETELSGSLLGKNFPAEFGASTPDAPIQLCGLDLGSFAYYRLSNKDTTGESSYQTILASFTNGYAHRDLPLLYSELLGASDVDQGLSGTKIGTHLAEVLQTAKPDEDEEYDDDVGQLDLDLLDEVACLQSSDLKLRSSKTRTHQVLCIDQALDVTEQKPFVIVFGYHKDGNVFSEPVNPPPHLPLHATADGHYLLLLPAFTLAEEDEVLLGSLARCLIFLKTYKFKLLGVVVLIEEIQTLSTDGKITTHTLRMVSAICGTSNLSSLVCIAQKDASGPDEVLVQLLDHEAHLVEDNFDDYCDQIKDLLTSHWRNPHQGLLESLSLVKELDSGLSLATTDAGQLVQQLLMDSLSETQAKLSKFHHGTASPAQNVTSLNLKALYLQLSLIRLNESYSLYQKVFTELSENVGLDKAIRRLEGLLLCTGDLRGGKDVMSVQLGGLYQAHLEQFGERTDLEKGIGAYQDAIRILDIQWENAEAGGYVQGSDRSTLDQEAYAQRRASTLQSLTESLDSQFKLWGKKNDLVDAITHCRDVVTTWMERAGWDSAKKATAYHALGSLLKTKFEVYFDDINDVDNAISSFQSAQSQLTSPTTTASAAQRARALPVLIADICSAHTIKSKYHTQVRNDRQQALSDLEVAIMEYENMRPEPSAAHPAYPALQNVKCKAWAKHYKLSAEIAKDGETVASKIKANIDVAVRAGEEAVLYSKYSAQECTYLLNLGKAYAYRYLFLGPSYARANKSDIGEDESLREWEEGDLDEALLCMMAATECETALHITRFKAARNWGKWAQIPSDPLSEDRPLGEREKEVLKAYEYCVKLLSELVPSDIPIDEQHRRLEKIQSVVYMAVEVAISYAVRLGKVAHGPHSARSLLEKAVVWFEHGRGIVWKEYFRRDSLVDEVRVHLGTATGTEADLVQDWENNCTLRKLWNVNNSKTDLGRMMDESTVSTRKASEIDPWYQGALDNGKKLLQKMKGILGGGGGQTNGSQNAEWDRLKQAARHGPVVLLNVTENRRDALVVVTRKPRQAKLGGRVEELKTEIQHIDLKDAALSDVKQWEKTLKEVLEEGGLKSRGSKPVSRISGNRDSRIEKILKDLWRLVVSPILRVLRDEMKLDKDTRLFWCASGAFAFLPLHAAGDYHAGKNKKTTDCVQSWFVPSYVPSLEILLRGYEASPSNDPKKRTLLAVAVADNAAAGFSDLPGTLDEVEAIQKLFKGDVKVLVNGDATEGQVKKNIQRNWAHFACHGEQNPADGLKSALVLTGRERLTLRELIELNIEAKSSILSPEKGEWGRRKEFAYLSACQSASGDTTLPEEHVHLAAGMLVAGYLGVVASMWSIGDKEGMEVAKGVYSRVGANGGYQDIAKALRDAVEELRKKSKADQYLAWLPFIHVGL
ncbi:CHAT domain-containing protein [Coprinopsis sp. MPI-PUGE-AT-0042]|nr:CHAT domain-containing protein [Coprinopsis sp. MPI-PUGE-AT-0042]